jgi:hypothetical protein
MRLSTRRTTDNFLELAGAHSTMTHRSIERYFGSNVLKLMFNQSGFEPDDVSADDGGEVAVLAVKRKGGHRLHGALPRNFGQRVDVNLPSTVRQFCKPHCSIDLDEFHILVLERQRVDVGRHLLARGAPARSEVNAD